MHGVVLVGWLAVVAFRRRLTFRWEHPVGACGVLLLGLGSALGLFGQPACVDLSRLHTVGRPELVVTGLTVGVATVCALLRLCTGRRWWESATEAASEVALVQGTMLLWVRIVFSKAVEDGCGIPDRAVVTTTLVVSWLAAATLLRIGGRTTASAVATIGAGVTAPAMVFGRLWHLHSVVDLRGEVPWGMEGVVALNTWGLVYLTVWFVAQRWRIAVRRSSAHSKRATNATHGSQAATVR